jgi:hypothetical protein
LNFDIKIKICKQNGCEPLRAAAASRRATPPVPQGRHRQYTEKMRLNSARKQMRYKTALP